MIITVNWQIVILDVWVLTCLILIAAWFVGDLRRKPMMMMGGCFIIIGLGFFITTLGDLLLAMGFSSRDHWILTREFRSLPLRYCLGVGLTVIAGVLRFGKFNGRK